MKKIVMLALSMFAFTTIAAAEQVVTVESHPTQTIVSAWHEFQVSDGGLHNVNAWINVWPGGGRFGIYGYTQAAQPGYSQVYGGLAGRVGVLEGGAGLGLENANGDFGLRHSLYLIVSRGRLTSANWCENSHQSSWWLLSVNTYSVVPDRFEVGYRLQRYVGGGPMVRYTVQLKRLTAQPYLAALYDGDQLNPFVGLSLTYK